MKLDILAIAAHPDDVELCCAGTLMKHIDMGYKVGIVDLTQGELGTRGNGPLRLKEAARAAEIMGITVRENMNMADGFFQNDKAHQLKLIEVIRKYQPEIVFANAIRDRHIDHGRGSQLISNACFLSGLVKIETFNDGIKQGKWRPKAVYHMIQDRHIEPDFVIDISEYLDRKNQAIMAYGSQFFNTDYENNASELQTPISGQDFFKFLEARSRVFGRPIGVEYAEGFNVERVVGVKNIFDLV
jgi:bacillithiol biosynthesis deacetylase BshB1